MDLDLDQAIEMQRRMLRIRHFEEAVELGHKRGEIPGSVHLSIGQEAATVGACMALESGDYMTGTHRSHGHPIGKGASLRPLMAEIYGRATGVCRGKGGSMHLADFSVGSLGESGIVGSAIPIATGAAFSAKVKRTDRVSLAFFGDGAGNQGSLYESMNLASIWDLPVIYLCENNHFAVTLRAEDAIGGGVLWQRAAGFGMPGIFVENGQDILGVYEAVSKAVRRARAGEGPSFVEVSTYRFRGHSEGMRNVNTSGEPEERDQWLSRDPINLFREHLQSHFGLTAEQLDQLETEVIDEIADAVKFAKESPFPEPEMAFSDVFTDRSSHTGSVV